MEITSQQYNCEERGHIGKVAKTEYRLEDGDVKEYTVLYGCTKCDATSPERWADWGVIAPNKDHVDSEHCLCFGCKAKGLQLNTGDAAGNKNMPQKKWNAELNAYSAARAQGIQPAGTTMRAVEDALKKSEKAGKAYDANTGGYKE